jgi:Ca2+-binding RTX toxin-like protein
MITVGNGDDDSVVVNSFIASDNTIIVGNGARDSVFVGGSNETIKVGNGNGDTVAFGGGGNNTITLGDGDNDTMVNLGGGTNNSITLGDGNGNVVNDSKGSHNTIKVGNGNDTIYVGSNDTVKVGTGQDSFVFAQTTPGNIGAVTLIGFDPSKDSFTFSNQLATFLSIHDDDQGNAVISVDNDPADTITLAGVHAAALHPSDFHFADPAVLVAAAAHSILV